MHSKEYGKACDNMRDVDGGIMVRKEAEEPPEGAIMGSSNQEDKEDGD